MYPNQGRMTPSFDDRMYLRTLGTDLKQFSSVQTDVSMVLAKQVISSEAKSKNLVFSPLSIHVILALIATGASGRTLEEILAYFKCRSVDDLNMALSRLATVLFTDGSSHGGPHLSSANGVWVDQMAVLQPGFKEIAQNLYKAVAELADFANQGERERARLNGWAEEKTNGLIKDIIPPGWIKPETVLIFGNALYFKGLWEEKFNETYPREHDFYLLNGSSIKAPFMTSYNDQYISAFNGFKVLRLPYKQEGDARRYSMYIFLPDFVNWLPYLVDAFATTPGFLESHLPHESVGVSDFCIPKFKICFDFEATEVCKELGIVSAFSGGLTKMVNGELHVSSILHKSFIEVNEGGTEAAAVTFASMACYGSCGPQPPPKKRMNFVADHPFLFAIREDMTGMLLFVGQVVNPLVE